MLVFLPTSDPTLYVLHMLRLIPGLMEVMEATPASCWW
jgi:hypothetical protein